MKFIEDFELFEPFATIYASRYKSRPDFEINTDKMRLIFQCKHESTTLRPLAGSLDINVLLDKNSEDFNRLLCGLPRFSGHTEGFGSIIRNRGC